MVIWIDAKRYIPEKVETPYPSHRDCAHYMIDNPKEKWTCVHGIVEVKGKVKSRAWLKKGTQIFDVATGEVCSQKQFMKDHELIAAYIYSIDEVKANMKKFRRYGRWEMR
jgi:hypothetical protein